MIRRINHQHEKGFPSFDGSGSSLFQPLCSSLFSPSSCILSTGCFATPRRPLITQELDVNQPGHAQGQRASRSERRERPWPGGRRFSDGAHAPPVAALCRSGTGGQGVSGWTHNPASSNFHRWLTAQEFGETFSVAGEELNVITTWLQRYGFLVNLVYPSGMVIDFSGSAGQVREAFRTEIHYLEVNGVEHIANMSDPQIPAALAPAVAGVVSLHDFVPPPVHKLVELHLYLRGATIRRWCPRTWPRSTI